MTELREGDIYRWRWKDEARDRDRGSYGSYHCCSQWAVVSHGRLLDTYWFGSGQTEINPGCVDLTFVANMADLTKIREDEARYYRRDDIVDMRHANSTREPIYRRAGATRDATAMSETLEHLRDRNQSEIRWATERLDTLKAAELLISEGRLDEVHLPCLPRT